ncbi:glycerophosphodiester phosphodiesterase family protein [Bacteroides acidifaciens]|uniref:glycerophosphodiester phosphodiesterase family protein n=1 Tax=Bacteroides acidifaciens TaxID=85831 RepID=UPI0025A97D84|nr:glycerophosphodiester phosphodiesterase family protein [Bacteroides acidifaciens]
MKKILLACSMLLALTAYASTPNRADVLREKILSGDTSEVLVVAHRGDWRYAPENSIAAIEHSIAVGVDIVELDLQLSKDSVLFVIHDSKLERTTTGKGRISDWTADSLRTLKLKNGAGIRTMHSLPTLEEAMLAAKGRVLVNLDKADRYFDLLMPVLEKTGTSSQVIMKGSKPAVQVDSLYGAYLDKVIYMPVVNLDKPDVRELMDGYFNNLKPVAYELVYATDDDNGYAIELKSRLDGKALIWYNTLWDTLCGGHDDDRALSDPDGAFGFLIDTLGARIIQTDRAELLLDYLRSRSLHK